MIFTMQIARCGTHIRGGSRIFSQGGSGGTQCHKDATGVSGEGTEGGLEYEVL